MIAPAGSGKTTVLVARVQQLLSYGVPANRILCLTFNTAAAKELRERLEQRGVAGVEARSFHSLGRRILDQESLLRPNIGATTYAQWRGLVRNAMSSAGEGVWIDAADAQNAISDLKIVEMVDPSTVQARLTAESRPFEKTVAALYQPHEQNLENEPGTTSTTSLPSLTAGCGRDAGMPGSLAAAAMTYVLVDEYQDIDPAQETLLLRPRGAGRRSLLRRRRGPVPLRLAIERASERIVELDQTYPGLERHAITTNYRCPAPVVDAASRLIEHNLLRFPKEIRPAAGASREEVEVIAAESLDAQATHVARLVNDQERGQIVVLARTTRVLRTVALALARAGVKFDGPERLLTTGGVQGVLLAYLRLFSNLANAREDDIDTIFRVPNRYLPDRARPYSRGTTPSAIVRGRDQPHRHKRRMAAKSTRPGRNPLRPLANDRLSRGVPPRRQNGRWPRQTLQRQRTNDPPRPNPDRATP